MFVSKQSVPIIFFFIIIIFYFQAISFDVVGSIVSISGMAADDLKLFEVT